MGNELLQFYRERVSRNQKLAFSSAFLIGLLVHLYKFTNTLPNRDSLYNYYSANDFLDQGRWGLKYFCFLSSYFDLPWVNGLFCLILIGLTAVMIADIFKMDNPILIFLSGGLLAAFPSVTEIFFFEFLADGFMAGMLLAAIGVRLTLFGEHRKSRHILAILLLCLACSCYQAWISFALVTAICYFLTELPSEQHTDRECLLWVRNQAIVYVGALGLYYLMWKILLRFSGLNALDYQGMDTVGKLSVGMLVNAFKQTVRSFATFFIQWNFLRNGLSAYIVLNLCFLLLLAAGLGLTLLRSRAVRRPLRLVLFLLCLAAIPFCTFIWYFTSEGVWYALRMEQSLALLYILAGVLAERQFKPRWSTLTGAVLAAIIFNFGLQANICYWYMQAGYTRSLALGQELVSRIHLLDADAPSVAVIGTRNIDLINYYPEYSRDTRANAVYLTGSLLENDLLFDQLHVVNFLNGSLGFACTEADAQSVEALKESEAVSEMGIWPASDSVRLIDGTVVIKFASTEKN